MNANQKILLVYFNSKLIIKVHPLVSYNLLTKKAEQIVEGLEGFNNLTLTMTGPNPPDGNGYKISNISLRQLVDLKVVHLINNSIANPLFSSFVGIPAARVIFGELLNVFVNL